jgi:hypothetical protein
VRGGGISDWQLGSCDFEVTVSSNMSDEQHVNIVDLLLHIGRSRAAAHQPCDGDKGVALVDVDAVLHQCRNKLYHLAKHLHHELPFMLSMLTTSDVQQRRA